MNSLGEPTFDDVIEVRRVLWDDAANELLSEGWRLLHVSSRQWIDRNNRAHKDVMYIVGRLRDPGAA